jgi:phage-related minor tail protein
MVEEETAKRIEELVKKRVEEELEKRKEEIEAEVLRRVEEAKKIMEKQMMEEMERRREQQLEEEKKREVRQKDTPVGVESCGWVKSSVGWVDISFMGRDTKLYVMKLQFDIAKVYFSQVFKKYSH